MKDALRHTLKLLVVAFITAALSLFLQGCTAAQRQLATCIASKTTTRCLPQCASCVREVVTECKAQCSALTGACAVEGKP